MAAPNGMSRDPTEPERLGRMHARIGRESSTASQIARRLGGAPAAQPARPTTTPPSSPGTQRVIVRARISRHHASTIHAGLRRYASYLTRDSASVDGHQGHLWGPAEDQVPASSVLTEWAQDRHHFRLMLSPEQAGDLADLTGYARRVLSRMERDLGTPLTYLAVTHHNTDNPHIHVLIRGKHPDGRDLVIPWNYLTRRLPQRAREIATDLLGPRDPLAVPSIPIRLLRAQRYTSLDRQIVTQMQVRNGLGTMDVGPAHRSPDRAALIRRLAFLSRLGLAQKGRGTLWQVDPDVRSKLVALGQQQARMARLYPYLGAQAVQIQSLPEGVPVRGRIVVKGTANKHTGRDVVVLQTATGQRYDLPLRASRTSRKLQIGDTIEATLHPAEQSASGTTYRKLSVRILALAPRTPRVQDGLER